MTKPLRSKLFLATLAACLLPLVGASAASAQTSATCTNGMAGPFPCKNIDLQSVTTLAQLGGAAGNDIWGWTDPETGHEYALIGTTNTTGFVDITDPKSPEVVGQLPTNAGLGFPGVLWRDIKVIGNYAYMVSEIDGSGMQVFDLTRLRDGGPTTVYDSDADYFGPTDEMVGNTHNIAVNPETDTAYLVGTNTCSADVDGEDEAGGLHMVDVSDPLNPEFLGCALNTIDGPDEGEASNYVHDVECQIYDGPDSDYTGREICFGSNEDLVVVYDVTDKANPQVISTASYESSAYTHQGSLTPNGKYFLFGDELDEQEGTVPNTTTYILDVRDLDELGTPVPFSHETNSIDHNLYLNNGLAYEANYAAGLRILNYNDQLLGQGKLNEVAFFDAVPGADPAEFAGVWSNYAYFESGNVAVSNIENNVAGLLVLKPTISSGSGGGGPEDPNNPDGGDGGGGDGPGGGDPGGPGGGDPGGDDPTGNPAPLPEICDGTAANRFGGTDEGETITGTAASDAIDGLGGDDTLFGLEDDDCLLGSDGNDVLRGQSGADFAVGGKGRDELRGQGDDDELRGGGQKDGLRGGGGDDKLVGNRGGDRINAGAGDDLLRGGKQRDRLNGSGGDDVLRGGAGRDLLRGGQGKNRIFCGKGRDRVVDIGPRDETHGCERVLRR